MSLLLLLACAEQPPAPDTLLCMDGPDQGVPAWEVGNEARVMALSSPAGACGEGGQNVELEETATGDVWRFGWSWEAEFNAPLADLEPGELVSFVATFSSSEGGRAFRFWDEDGLVLAAHEGQGSLMSSLQEGLQVSPSRRLGTTGSGCEQERELELLVEADQEQLVLVPGQRGSVAFNGENLVVQAGHTSVPAYPRTCGEMREAEHWMVWRE